MKKLIALLLVAALALTVVACSEDAKTAEPTATQAPTTAPATETKVMTYAEYMAAEIDAQVCIEAYVQATQSWWDNKITVYAQDQDGAYFLYEMACSEEDAAKLEPGTKIRVTGDKAEWAGEIEIMNATFEFVEGEGTYIANTLDVTELLGTEKLIEMQNRKVIFKGMMIEKITYKNDEPGDDIYVTVSYNDASYEFCVERYLTGPETELYNAVAYLQVGEVVDIEGYLYWYEGVNTHITGISREGIPIVDLTPYVPYLGTWYLNGSDAARRLVLSEDRTWLIATADGTVQFTGSLLAAEDGMQLYDPEGILVLVMTPVSEQEVSVEVYMDSLNFGYDNFKNVVTNSNPEDTDIGNLDAEQPVELPEEEPTSESAPVEETFPSEEEPTEG